MFRRWRMRRAVRRVGSPPRLSAAARADAYGPNPPWVNIDPERVLPREGRDG